MMDTNRLLSTILSYSLYDIIVRYQIVTLCARCNAVMRCSTQSKSVEILSKFLSHSCRSYLCRVVLKPAETRRFVSMPNATRKCRKSSAFLRVCG